MQDQRTVGTMTDCFLVRLLTYSHMPQFQESTLNTYFT